MTAVLVAHDGIRWVHRALDGLAGQTRPPDRVVAVDTGSQDGTDQALEAALGPGRVCRLGRDTGFGAAAAAGLAAAHGRGPMAADRTEWLWLLHDDSEPEPDALERLLEVVDRSPSIGIAGPKVRGWYDRRLLVEVGLTVGRGGRRETGVERHEHDQGQHDGVHEVLAVGSAGMLVRRDVWDALGGFDPWLPLLRDDVDLGWRANLAGHRVVCVTAAVVHHAEAGAHGRRRLRATVNRPHLVDRRHGVYVLLANLPLLSLPLALLRAMLGGLLRALVLLLGKLPADAVDELLAVAAVLGRPDRLVRARLRRRRTRRLPARSASRLLAPTGLHLRHSLEAMAALMTRGEALAGRGRHVAADGADTGPVADEADSLRVASTGLIRRLFRAPVVLLALGLAVLALFADRAVLGTGPLAGGALLPATGAASDLWRAYLAGWHPVGLGTAETAPPYLAVLGGLGGLLGNSAAAAVGLLVLGAVPLSGLSAYLFSRGLVSSRLLRVWAAVAYALLPAVTGAVATGRVGLLLAAILLPPTCRALAGAMDWPERRGTWRAAGAGALLLTVACAGVPLLWPLAAALVVLGLVLVVVIAPGALRLATVPRLLTALVVPAVLLAPWSRELFADPVRVWREPGLPSGGLSDPGLPAWAVALLHPGGPGMYPALLSLPLLAAALAALLRVTRRAPVLAGWLLALVGLAAGLLARQVSVPAAGGGTGPAWPGPGTLLAGLGLLVAAVVGAEGAAARIRRLPFGVRQPTAVLLAFAAGVAPLVAAGWWVARGVDGPLHRDRGDVVPAFVAAEAAEPDRPRTLVLRGAGGALQVSLVGERGPRLGDGDVAPDGAVDRRLLDAVGGLLAGRDDAVAALQPYAIRYVLLVPPVDRAVAARLDGQPGLARVSAERGSALWKSDVPVGRVRLLPDGPGATPVVVPAGPVSASGTLPASTGPGLLTVADTADPGWRATLDGRALQPRPQRGLQAFALPGGGGAIHVWHEAAAPDGLRWAQLGVLGLALLLALPGGRRPEEDDLPPEEQAAQAAGRRRRAVAGATR